MKVFLEFNLPEEVGELRQALHGGECHSLLYGLVWDTLRNAVKHGSLDGQTLTTEQIDVVERIRAGIWSEMEERGIKLE